MVLPRILTDERVITDQHDAAPHAWTDQHGAAQHGTAQHGAAQLARRDRPREPPPLKRSRARPSASVRQRWYEQYGPHRLHTGVFL
jgi:hypothetical protein